MTNSFIIVESPAKVRTIKKYLGDDYVIKASIGHIRDLPTNKLGIDLKNDFSPEYITIRGKGKIVKELKKYASRSKEIIIATDPDREGEAIAFHIAKVIGRDINTVKRVLFNEITEKGIKEGISNPQLIDMKKVNAQQARRVVDRLVGYQVSPILWRIVARGLSAGRVQSVALRMICEREEQILNFVPQEYWTISVLLKGGVTEPFTSELIKIDGKKVKIDDRKEADAIAADLKKQIYRVKSVSEKDIKRHPLPPYTTSTMQQDASRRLGFSPNKTMRIAQELYEGVDIGHGEITGLITYMRTDSNRISEAAITETRNFISQYYGDPYLPETSRHYRSKKGAQDAHEAVRPSKVYLKPREIKENLSSDQYKLYDLIWRRFLACQMKSAVYHQTSIDISAGERYLFRTVGSTLKFEGFLRVYGDIKRESEEDKRYIPNNLKGGEQLILLKITPEQHFTKPPSRFTESTLVKELDERGIGRPSTYSTIINTLYLRKYVDKIKRFLHPTELGKVVNKILISAFPDIFNISFTAHMEEELDKIESGSDLWVNVVRAFYKPFSDSLNQFQAKRKEIKESIEVETRESCEKCGRPMIIKWGKNGKFLSCSGFPECKNAKPFVGEEKNEEPDTGQVCKLCGSKMVLKSGRYGEFMACSKYPECRFTTPVTTGVKCPIPGCEGEVIKKKTKKKRFFYGCSNYPSCSFASWYKPVDVSCVGCGNTYLVEKWDKNRGIFYKCPSCKEEYLTVSTAANA